MNKTKFLKELETKLKILNEKERQDIITEYKSIIEEKVKNGQTEKEAVADFGDINELVNEILDAYKINTDYNNKTTDDKIKDFADKGEEIIKDGATKLASFSKKVVDDISNNDTLSIETIFEIIIKVFLLLFGFLILKIPFAIIRELGSQLLMITFSPLSNILLFIWELIIGTLYIISCILIGIIVFKKYFNTNLNSKVNKVEIKKEEKQDGKKAKATDQTAKKSETIKEENVTLKNDNSASKILWMIFKIIMIMAIYIPFLFATLGLITALTVIVYLMFKGLGLIGAFMIVLGLCLIFGYFTKAIYRVIINKAVPKIYPIMIAIPLIVLGGLFSIDNVMNITYYDEKPNYNYNLESKIYYEKVGSNVKIYNDTEGNINYLIDDSLADGEVKIELVYYDDLVKLSLVKYNNDKIIIDGTLKGVKLKKIINFVIDDLKKERVYDYSRLIDIDITVYSNTNTKVDVAKKID